MPRNLRWKWIVIATVVFGCVFGVIELPTSKKELLSNWNRNIRLGLDLKGGSHIVLQIQVQDAFKADADRVIEQLKELLSGAGIGSIDRNEPTSIETAEAIEVYLRGISVEKANDLRSLVTDTFGQEWVLSQQGATDYSS